MVFDLRTEAEMRLHSEKTARQLALKKLLEGQRAESGRNDDEKTVTTDAEPVA